MFFFLFSWHSSHYYSDDKHSENARFHIFVYCISVFGDSCEIKGLQFCRKLVREFSVNNINTGNGFCLFSAVFIAYFSFLSFVCERMLRTSSNPIYRVKGSTLCEVDWDQKCKGNFVQCADTLVQTLVNHIDWFWHQSSNVIGHMEPSYI